MTIITDLRRQESLGFYGGLMQRAFWRVLYKELTGTGATPAQFVALGFLMGEDRVSQSDLAQWLYVTRATAATLADRI